MMTADKWFSGVVDAMRSVLRKRDRLALLPAASGGEAPVELDDPGCSDPKTCTVPGTSLTSLTGSSLVAADDPGCSDPKTCTVPGTSLASAA